LPPCSRVEKSSRLTSPASPRPSAPRELSDNRARLPANQKTRTMSKEKTLHRSHRCSAMHHADGCPQHKQDLVAGALTANAPSPRGGGAWMRLSHSQVTRAGDEKSGATPQVSVKGCASKWCARKRSRNADALPYGKRAHPTKTHPCLDDLSDSSRMRKNECFSVDYIVG
jgi:hypothetical protein